MVLSRINSKINYIDDGKIDSNDLNYSAAKYEITIMNVDIIIAVGKANISFIDNNIIFFNIYLVDDDKIISKLGLYELDAKKIENFLDEDGDLNLDLLNMPILNPYVSEEYLSTKIKKTLLKEDKTKPKEVILKSDVKDSYDESKSETWIEKYLKSNKYEIKDNEGGGDCLFFVLEDALKDVDSKITVQNLRKLLSDSVTEEIFKEYKSVYDSLNNSIKNDTIKLKELQKENKGIIDQMKITKDRNYQSELVKKGKAIKEEFNKIQEEKSVSNELLKEVKFMKGIKNIDNFKKKIQTCDFWADTWAISTLERLINIKLILFSYESYESSDLDNVLQCGQLNDSILENKGIFTPKYYILCEYNGYHYRIIKYDKKEKLQFEELSNTIKDLIVNNCMEGSGGVYNLIPDMVEYKKTYTIPDNEDEDKETLEESQINSHSLYDPNIVFQFYSKSNDKPLPGKGSGESINKDDVKIFAKLGKIPNWRKKLSNFWEHKFQLDGHNWLSVEHYYQGSKFKNGNNDYYLQFSLDSDSVLSKDPIIAKSAGGKTGKLDGKTIRPPDIKIDDDFFSSERSVKEMNKAQMAKFTQIDELKEVLKETKNARLMHYIRGSPPIEFTNLMKIRDELIK